MSTLEEALSQRHRLSVWHVYREGFDHISVTPFLVPGKEYGGSYDENRSYESHFQQPNSYFVHLPSLLFHNPPRTLRRGHKKGDPICTIKLGAFWNEWIVQFSDNLKNVIDPRGLVRWKCRSNPDNSTSNDIREWKGYKVRTWRVWGETGAEYHRTVNARRKAIKEEEVTEVRAATAAEKCKTPDLEMGPVESESGVPSDSQSRNVSENPSCPGSLPAAVPLPTVADEAFRLKWSSPLSIRTRTYCFEYAGIEFSWEGTRDVHYNHMWNKRLMPFNHLKLVARVPGSMEETYVAQYISSFSHDKHGQLWIFDSVVTDLLERTGHPSKWIKQTENKERFCLDINWDVQQTRLYDMIVATSMCMIIGEWQKRSILWMLCSTLYMGYVLGAL